MRKTALTTPVLFLAALNFAWFVSADVVNLTYFNTVGLMDEFGILLDDGCIVQLIYAGADGVINIPNVYNGGATGDDVIWQTISIGDGGVDPGTGTFIGNYEYDESFLGDQVYVRFFNAPSWPDVTYYGQSPLHTLEEFFGLDIWDITDGGLFLYTEYPFMIIPEPETWMTLLPGLAFAALFFRKKKKKEPEDSLAA